MPADPRYLQASLAAYLGMGMLISLLETDLAGALGRSLVDAGALLAIAYLALRLRNHSGRFPQTAAALTASGAMLSVVSYPVLSVAYQFQSTDAAGLVAIAWLLVVAWTLAVISHILRHALDTTLMLASVLTIGYVALTITLISVLWPAAPA